MKVTVINGNARHGSTWNCTQTILKKLENYGELEVTEFFLPKDMPHFCCGCFSCFLNGEGTCPHAASVQPIADALLDADLIVLTSSVYALDVTGQMKALLDHLCYQWMSHRPNPLMFNKIALTVVTTAGAGLSHTTKTMRNSLQFWGVKRIHSYKNPVSAMKWSDVPEEKQAKIQKEAAALAHRIAKEVQNAKKLPSPFLRSVIMRAMAGMMRKNDWNLRDRQHWEDHKWFRAEA